MALLHEYAARHSEAAFEELVARRIDFVHSAALRQVRDPLVAAEVTQAVFILLAQKAGNIPDKTNLGGWLFRATRFTALAQIRAAIKRQQRQQEICMQSEMASPAPDPVWEQMSPLLDEALAGLGEKDRQAVLLRYFEQKSLAQVGTFLGAGEDTARKRVARALEKLRKFFARRGVTLTVAGIGGALAVNSVKAAPVTLTKSVAAAAVVKGAAAGGSTLTLVKGALKLMAWTKAKTAMVAGLGILAAAGTATVVTTEIVAKSKEAAANTVFEEIWSHPNSSSLPLLGKAAPAFIIRPTRYPNLAGGCWNNGGQGFEVNIGLRDLVAGAYEWSLERTIFPEQMPDGQYDLMEALPAGQNEGAFKAELKKQFGLVAHTETRETDVLLLKVKDPAELQHYISNGVQSENYMSGDDTMQYYHLKRRKLSELSHDLEGWIGTPLIDQTGMAGSYDFEFQWATKLMGTGGVSQALRDQLGSFGFELVPSREPIEMLVVEKSNPAR